MTSVFRPSQSPETFFELAERQSEAEARNEDVLAEDDSNAEIMKAVEKEARRILLRSLKRKIGEANRLGKDTAKQHRRPTKDLAKAETRVRKLVLLLKTYRDDEKLHIQLKKAEREVTDLRVQMGRAGQAAHEWSVWAKQLQELLEQLKRQPLPYVARELAEAARKPVQGFRPLTPEEQLKAEQKIIHEVLSKS